MLLKYYKYFGKLLIMDLNYNLITIQCIYVKIPDYLIMS